MSRNANQIRFAVRTFVEASIRVRRKREPIGDEANQTILRLFDSCAKRNRRDPDHPFGWGDAAALMDEVCIYHLTAFGSHGPGRDDLAIDGAMANDIEHNRLVELIRKARA